MPKVLTYVDEVLIRQMGTGLIGSEVQLTDRQDTSAGINFKVLLSQTRGVAKTTTTKMADLLPEVLADAVFDAIKVRIEDLSGSRSRLIAGGGDSFKPGTPVIVTTCQLAADGKDSLAELSGEQCVCYRLKMGEFFFHCYGPRTSEKTLDSLIGQPVEVAGILRYCSPYKVPGALSLNLGLRIGAVWFR